MRKIQRRRRDSDIKRQTVATPCLYCSEVYSMSKAGEGWMKCGECDLWAHKSVQGTNAGRPSVTFVTKTGVAHFSLHFLQLNKTEHFSYVCFAIFLMKLHRNYNIQSVVNIINFVIKQTITDL